MLLVYLQEWIQKYKYVIMSKAKDTVQIRVTVTVLVPLVKLSIIILERQVHTRRKKTIKELEKKSFSAKKFSTADFSVWTFG